MIAHLRIVLILALAVEAFEAHRLGYDALAYSDVAALVLVWVVE